MRDMPPPQKSHEMSLEDIVQLLKQYGVPYETWGTGGTKFVSDLLTEILEGEATLEDREGVLMRKVDGVGLDVFAKIDGVMHYLVEDRQVFASDGTVRRRHLSTSLGEKVKPGEAAEVAMVRALLEELGVEMDASEVKVGDTSHKIVPSNSYPGILVDRALTMGVVTLSQDQVNPEGYVEHQPHKDNYFIWQRLEQDSASQA